MPLTFKAVNESDLESYGTVTPALRDADGTEVATSKFRPLDVMPRGTEDVADYIALFAAVKDEELSAGRYSLVFKDEAGHAVSDPIEVTVAALTEETAFKVSDFRLEGDNPVKAPESVVFGYKLECTAGMYFSQLDLLIFPGDGGYDIYHKSSERAYLTAGESTEGSIDADLSELKDGEYIALIYNAGHTASDRIYFRIDRTASGLDSIEPDTAPAEVYDLSGRKLQAPPGPGIYIINGTKTLVRF